MAVGLFRVTVDVTGGLDAFLTNAPATANANTQGAYAIEWEVFSVTQSISGNTASIGFQRFVKGFQFYNYKGCTVKIEIYNYATFTYSPLFWGVCTGQTVDKDTCTLSLIGFELALNDVQFIGSNRQGHSYETISILNENGQLDQNQSSAGAIYLNIKESVPGTHVVSKWNRTRATAFYLEEVAGYDFNAPLGALKNYIDAEAIGTYLRTNFDTSTLSKEIDSEYQRSSGIYSELLTAMNDEGQIVYFIPAAGTPWTYPLYIQDRFYDTAKNISSEFTQGYSTTPANLAKVNWDFNINYDFQRPDEIYAISGKELVTTHICIDPSLFGGTDYGKEIEVDEDINFLRFQHLDNDTISDPVLSSDLSPYDYDIETLFGPAKQEIITNVYESPFATVDTTTGAYTFRSEPQMIFFKFKTDFKPTGLTADFVLMGSELWETLKTVTVGPATGKIAFSIIADKLESLDYRILKDSFGLEIDGFTAVDNAGVYEADYTCLTDYVSLIIVPVVVELERRRIAKSVRSGAAGTIATTESAVTDAAPPATDYLKNKAQLAMSEYVKPIRFIAGFESWDNTSGLILQTGSGYDYDAIDTLKAIAKATLTNAIVESSDSLTITIPVEYERLLPDTYPHEIGDWLTSITGTNGAQSQALIKPMALESKDYNREFCVLHFR